MNYVAILLCAFISFAAAAQTSPQAELSLEQRQVDALAAGDRIRVIVQFEIPNLEDDNVSGEERDLAQARLIERASSAILQRAFNADASDLGIPSDRDPHLIQTFQYTPAMVMRLNSAEIESLTADSSVTRIETDGLDRPMLDESVAQVGASLLHGVGFTGSGRAIAVLDTGIDYNHPAFQGRISDSACFSTSSLGDNSTSRCEGEVAVDTTSPFAAQYCRDPIGGLGCRHGTHVASIAGGIPGTHSSLGEYPYTGVAPGASLVPVQVFSQVINQSICGRTSCIRAYVSDQIEALEWLYQNRSRLRLSAINMSLGGDTRASTCHADPRTPIFDQLRAAGVAVVVSSGNQGESNQVSIPACIESAFTTAGVGRSLAPFGNTGPLVDFVAPGENIEAASLISLNQLTATQSGTSMSAPHVSGVFAILSQAFPQANLHTISTAMLRSGTPVTMPGGHVRPMVRADLAYNYLATLYPANTGVTAEIVGSDTSAGYYQDARSFPPIRIRITNNSAEPADWRLANVSPLLSLSSNQAQPIDGDPRSGVFGRIAAGASKIVEVRVNQTTNTPQTYPASLAFGSGGEVLFLPITFQFGGIVPPNDDIEQAIPLRGDFSLALLLNGATYQTNEAQSPGYHGSIWYEWTPRSAGRAFVNALYRDPDLRRDVSMRVHVYQRDNGQLDLIGAPNGRPGQQRTFFNSEAGSSYLIQIELAHPYLNEISITGGFDFRRTVTLGTEVHDPLPLPTSGHTRHELPAYVADARNDSDPASGPNDPYRVWAKWTAPADGVLHIRPDGGISSDHANTIAVFRRTDNASEHLETDSASLLELVREGVFDPSRSGLDLPAQAQSFQMPVAAGVTYFLRFGGSQQNIRLEKAFGMAEPGTHRLRAAVLPSARAVRYGQTATAFMTLINPPAAQREATNCRIEASQHRGIRMPFSYWETDSNNNVIGTENPVFDLSIGEAKSFVFAFQPVDEVVTDVSFFYLCDTAVSASRRDEMATDDFLLVALETSVIDLITIAATPSGDGILDVSNQRFSAFSAAAVNAGTSSGGVSVRATAAGGSNSFTAEVCESDPATGQCLAQRAPQISVNFDAGEVKTFTVFIRGEAQDQAFAPETLRAFLTFLSEDRGYTTGGSSVALRTLGD